MIDGIAKANLASEYNCGKCFLSLFKSSKMFPLKHPHGTLEGKNHHR